MIWLIGILAGLLFVSSGIDQLYKTVRDGNADGLSLTCLLQILAAYIFSFTYVYLQHGWDGPLHIQYSVSFLAWFVITIYKLFPRKK